MYIVFIQKSDLSTIAINIIAYTLCDQNFCLLFGRAKVSGLLRDAF
jgi:hypothetical protein